MEKIRKTRRDFLKLAGSLCFTGYIGLSPFKLFGKPESGEVEARFYEKMPGGKVRCLLCPNLCVRASGETGQCRVRENVNGSYFTRVYGNPCVIAIDPVEKCPLFHYQLPNPAFSIATAGCNLFCHYCQNWAFSQKGPAETKNYSLTPAQVIDKALEYKSGAISFFYTEPTIYIEYLIDIARMAREVSLPCIMVTAGFINPEPLKELLPLIDAFTVGLKGFSNDFFRKHVGGSLEPVLETLKLIHAAGRHLEIVTLLVPTLNDQAEAIKAEIDWIKANLGVSVPLHFTRFNPQYRLMQVPPTPASILDKARKEAINAGLQYVYTGNLPGHEGNHTYCPKCGRVVVERLSFKVLNNNHEDGKCLNCGFRLYGKW
ncbi:MAG: Radical SAM, Pyruvate-formate lyase-activating enzyme like [Candidatus Rifleibacterium amylolyticum]|nr:MAG: Radical SAM, Pyruvate-formate lyase-activating enzyme like [Candidatus Rifleibacterium amylolyticum]